MELDQRKTIIAAVRRAALDQAEVLARMAVEETGLGRVDDKTTKNRLVAEKAPGPEDLETEAMSGANGMMVTEWAPFGVVGAITPVTNPGATILSNAIAVASIADRLVRSMAEHGAYVLAEHELRRLERVIFTELGAPGKPGHVNPAWIGRDASRILAEIGVRPTVEPRLIVAEVPVEHSL